MTRTEYFAESVCPRCGAETYLALYRKTGNKAHLNRVPDQCRGNILLDKRDYTYVILQKPEIAEAIADGRELYLNHHATCEARVELVRPRVVGSNVVPFRRPARVVSRR